LRVKPAMTNHRNDKPPQWQTTAMANHRNGKPPQWQTTAMANHLQ
jgi:hypothetical protein